MSADNFDYIASSDSDKVVYEERKWLYTKRRLRSGVNLDAELPWSGIALSGGGIRAATFSLGVLQALAARDLLKRFDYISSVSGGGYIGSSLQWWWSKIRDDDDPIIEDKRKISFGLGPSDFPYGTAHPSATQPANDSDAQARNLAYLRSHGYYLTPGDGINVWSGVSVVLRTVLLSLIVWLPLVVLLFIILQVFDAFLLQPAARSALAWTGHDLNTFQSPLDGSITNYWVCSSANVYSLPCAFGLRLFYAVILWGYLLAVAVFVFISIAFALLSRAGQDVPKRSVRIYRALMSASGTILVFAWAGYSLYGYHGKELTFVVYIIIAATLGAVLVGKFFVDVFPRRAINGSYFLRRTLERYFGFLFVPTLGLLIIGLIPVLPYFLIQYMITQSSAGLTAGSIATTAFSVISGALSALYGYYTTVQKIIPGVAGRILAPIGSAVFLYGTLLFGYALGVIAFQALAYPSGDFVVYIQVVVLVAILLAAIIGAVASVNQIGLHRFYRDRLMETFMPASEAIARGRADYSPVADRLQLSDLVSPINDDPSTDGSRSPVPFPLINTLAIITDDPNRQLTSRGGDNFILTPLFIGSTATGWARTKSYIDWFGPMTLASAMAASGAAVNSNAGYLGTGPTRNWLVSMVMAILNMRLGLWIGNPARKNRLSGVPTYFRPMLTSGLLGWGRSKTSPFLELADGGNFENLGVYELVRRKLSLIVVVDGEADSSIALPALVSAAHRVHEDFGADISFIAGKGPERLVPVAVASGVTYPAGATFASAPFLVGQIRYKDNTFGTLIYIKATLIKDIAFTTSGYRADHADFPHQTTVDQFFDPDQFEAYRDLGFCSASLMIDAVTLDKLASTPKEIISRYKSC